MGCPMPWRRPGGVLIDLWSLRHRSNQRDIGPEPFDFALDVVHGPERQNVTLSQAYQIRQCSPSINKSPMRNGGLASRGNMAGGSDRVGICPAVLGAR